MRVAPSPIEQVAVPVSFTNRPVNLSQEGKHNGDIPFANVLASQALQHAVPVMAVAEPVREESGSDILTVPESPEIPEDHICLAWISCLCFCPPLGIMAIINSRLVHDYFSGGDIDAAKKASRKAWTYAWSAFIIGFVFIFCIVIIMTTQHS